MLPPLNGLRAFEAAARHMSFAKAADELAVTPAAISHQIKALESFLGVRLFRRQPGALHLTEAGRLLAPGLSRGFSEIRDAVDFLTEQDCCGPLTVSAAPSFAALWLVPRLASFAAENPEVEVRLDASTELVDFSRGDVDVAIRYGAGAYPGLMAERLFDSRVTPVVSPALVAETPIATAEDLLSHRLLHIAWGSLVDGMPTWAMWLKAAGVDPAHGERGARFADWNLTVQAALAGQGVALVDVALVRDHLADGRLVRPFKADRADTGNGFAYWLVAPERVWRKAKVRVFRTWLADQVRGMEEPDTEGGTGDRKRLIRS